MIVSTTWKHWFKNHDKNEIYSDNFDKVVSIMNTDKLSPECCFDQIKRRFEKIILLTLSTENLIISSFFSRKTWKLNFRRKYHSNWTMWIW